MGLGTGMSCNLFNVVRRTFVTLVLDKGVEHCNLFWMYFLRMLTKVLVRLFVPHVLQHHVRHGSDSSIWSVNSGFPSTRINLSPFTEDFRVGEQLNESID